MVRYKKNGTIYAMKSIRKAHVVKNKKAAPPSANLLGVACFVFRIRK